MHKTNKYILYSKYTQTCMQHTQTHKALCLALRLYRTFWQCGALSFCSALCLNQILPGDN